MSLLKKTLLALIVCLASPNLYAEEWQYTFRPGDTLWDLCARYIAAPDCWQKIAKRNKVSQPKHIRPGTRLYLPISWLKVLPASVKVLSVRGDTQYIKAGSNEPVQLEKSAQILVGDKIITADGSVTLQFADESILIVVPDSEVIFDTLSMYGESGMVDTRVRLNRGRAKAKVKPAKGPGSRYKILTPAAVAAVRGTEFRVVSEDVQPPQMRTEVLEGNVGVANDGGEQSLAAGYALKAVAGKKPSEPIKLLPAPVFPALLPETIRAFPWKLHWQKVSGAASYRVQVYKKGIFFESLAMEKGVTSNEFSVPELNAGDFRLAVRAVDERGFEGFEADYHVTVASPRTVDVLSVSSQVMSGEGNAPIAMIRWQWPALDGVSGYSVKILTPKESSDSQHETVDVMENIFEQQVSQPGTYRIQVAPVYGEQTLAYSPIESVTVRDENEAPLWLKIMVGAVFTFVIL